MFNDKITLLRDIKLLEFDKDPVNKSRLSDMKVRLKNLNQELFTTNQEMSRIHKLHQDVKAERNKSILKMNENGIGCLIFQNFE